MRDEAEKRRNAARNQALFREVNERIEDVARGYDHVEFLCECSRDDCTEAVSVSLRDYEAIRAEPTHFLVVAGHEASPDIERVVGRNNGYVVVQKVHEAAAVATALDPRQAAAS